MIRILNAEPLGFNPEAAAILSEVGELVPMDVDRPRLLAELPAFDALIVRLGFQIDDEVLGAGDRLRAVATATTGLDHVDMKAADARGIKVICLRGESALLETIPATAEHTWALLLALVRRIPWAAASVVNGDWSRDRYRGRELHGKTLGLIGVGRVGRQVARFAQAFGMEVGAYDPCPSYWPADIRRYADLEALLTGSDVVSIHVHLDDTTRGLLGPAQFDLMKREAILINTSRGEIVEQSALLDALRSNSLAGAAIDVVAGERSGEPGRALREYASANEDLLITPHIAGATAESMARTELMIANRLAEFLEA